MKTLLKIILILWTISIPMKLWAGPYAYPVPYTQKDPPADQRIHFSGLPSDGSIKIYTVAGELVKEIFFENFPSGDGEPSWDLTNSSGKTVTSGVYLFQVEGDGENSVGKLVIIR